MADLPPHTEPDPDVAGFLLGSLTEEEAARFESHLSECAVCRAEIDELAELPGLLADLALEETGLLEESLPAGDSVPPEEFLPPDEPLPPGLEARTFVAIERAAAPPAGAPSVVVPIGSARSARSPRRRRTPWLVAAAAAAAVVVGVVVIPKVGTSQSSPLATVALVGPGGGPAHGTAVIRAALTGLTIDLDVAGLKPSLPGTFYTCWLVGPGDTLAHQNRVSVGSFRVGSSGAADVHWTTGADLQQFGTLGVTLEPANGDPLHQGPKVLETA